MLEILVNVSQFTLKQTLFQQLQYILWLLCSLNALEFIQCVKLKLMNFTRFKIVLQLSKKKKPLLKKQLKHRGKKSTPPKCKSVCHICIKYDVRITDNQTRKTNKWKRKYQSEKHHPSGNLLNAKRVTGADKGLTTLKHPFKTSFHA